MNTRELHDPQSFGEGLAEHQALLFGVELADLANELEEMGGGLVAGKPIEDVRAELVGHVAVPVAGPPGRLHHGRQSHGVRTGRGSRAGRASPDPALVATEGLRTCGRPAVGGAARSGDLRRVTRG